MGIANSMPNNLQLHAETAVTMFLSSDFLFLQIYNIIAVGECCMQHNKIMACYNTHTSSYTTICPHLHKIQQSQYHYSLDHCFPQNTASCTVQCFPGSPRHHKYKCHHRHYHEEGGPILAAKVERSSVEVCHLWCLHPIFHITCCSKKKIILLQWL